MAKVKHLSKKVIFLLLAEEWQALEQPSKLDIGEEI